MPSRINRAIEMLEQDQAIYYTGAHSGHVLTRAQGREDAHTWADYINIGMEHGAFDMAGLAEYMQGLVEAAPTRSGHRTPAVVVEVPVNGTDAETVRHNAWQFRQILGRGVHGVLLCQAENADAVRAFVECCRYPHHSVGTDPGTASPVERMRGTGGGRQSGDPRLLGVGLRGRGSEGSAAPIWGLSEAEYLDHCDPWPLSPRGELLLGVKLESPEGVANCETILAISGIGFAELGPGDLGLALGYVEIPRDLYPFEMQQARARILAACQQNKVAFLEACTADNIRARLDEGVRVIAGGREDVAAIGRAHQRRSTPA